ncbi:hypothetical protein [Lysinibacillus xylanilyticus]|uniref:Uncharacterized protein n=1 Tax=Lysinibacillus xylanilyticus TaxID=582475 RepID=A0A2M9Q652_9BACI|nr:hypothetical protein [Lysinibacillus xylanilyticus]PJO43557.1 hypothetical protein CWD94_11860 [Lysinibacillus xylanilyticus]
MLKKAAIISGIVFSSILLVGCNGEPEVAVIDAPKNGAQLISANLNNMTYFVKVAHILQQKFEDSVIFYLLLVHSNMTALFVIS